MPKIMVNVPYLEDSDFNPDNSLKPHVNNGKPVLFFVFGSFCPHCTKVMPDIEKLAQISTNVVIVVLQTDGGPSEKEAAKRISKIDPSSSGGVPAFLGLGSNGKFIKAHKGPRDLASLQAFANSLR